MRYLPLNESDKRDMLAKIGVESEDDLLSSIPKEVRLEKDLDIPRAKSEMEITREIKVLADLNKGANMLSFLGGGCYNHYSPAAIDQLLQRSEFYTAYTPYQPEISQGTLASIFEFQTMIANLFGMDVSNASMYDGATALAEAALLSKRINKKRGKIAIAESVHPHYIETVKTYAEGFIDEIVILKMDRATGRIADSEFEKIDVDTISVLFQYPNYFGVIEDIHKIKEIAQSVKALIVPVITETTSLGILASPGDIDADIALGEGQPLGIPMNFGGPGVGLFTVKSKHMRKIPGRLVGKTIDKNGKECFVLTLAAREQHIKREKATSNICSNQGLMALSAAIYLSLMGKKGLKEVALLNIKRKEYLKNNLLKIKGVSLPFSCPTYNELTIMLENYDAKIVLKKLEQKGILGGIDAGKYFKEFSNMIIISTTELHSYSDIDHFTNILSSITGGDK